MVGIVGRSEKRVHWFLDFLDRKPNYTAVPSVDNGRIRHIHRDAFGHLGEYTANRLNSLGAYQNRYSRPCRIAC